MIEILDEAFPSAKQWKMAIHGMRNPKNSWNRMDSFICRSAKESGVEATEEECRECPYSMWEFGEDLEELLSGTDRNFQGCGEIGPLWGGFFRFREKDKNLAKNLISLGDEHMKFLRQLPVILDIKAPLYWWKQADTYSHTVKNACSTMHKLTEKKFTDEDFSTDYTDSFDLYDLAWGDIFPSLESTLAELNHYRDKYLETKDETYWYILNEYLPQSYNQLRTWSANYAVLFKICAQRADHKLGEWNTFITWILDNVPFFEELCFEKLCAVSPNFDRMFNS